MNNLVEVPLLSAFDVRKKYETPAGTLEILRSVQVILRKGEMVFITGKSGCGKSTLLHLLGGLDRPDFGKILFDGKDMTEMSERELARVRNRHVGFVFQFYHLLPELTVYENVLLPTLIAGKPNKNWTKDVLKRVRLWNRRTHYPSELSGGEQQRVAIARALVNHPSVVLCDEPTGNLDAETAASVMGLINELNREEGQAFLIVTHDEEMAAKYERSYHLQDGVLVSRPPVSLKPEDIINPK
ncbi:MAG TPA: ABC transporter ATP-binding protein [Candidatus Omnitrophota bacterium]|nr:ABC transporter ATP-binding protein [Candidatus Omnitrophota bacterium]HPS37066.1 ABC transporter ATP-binding protein [Candidatus Omnitrophota bacterium]